MKILITGISGCIGAATTQKILSQGIKEVVGLSRRGDLTRIASQHRAQVKMITGDITNLDQVRNVFAQVQPTHVIHLAAFQTPECQANPLQGMRVNVGGWLNVLDAARELKGHLQRMVFASSAAVYGPRSIYPASEVHEKMPYLPRSLYGYWKVAGEGAAQAFCEETGIATISLRLATTYGPGRDQGLTSAPTMLLKAAALGVPFEMPYQGREHYHFVDDVGAAFAQAATEDFAGYGVFNLRGQTWEVAEFISLVKEIAGREGMSQTAELRVSPAADAIAFICDLAQEEILTVFPEVPLTPLRRGIERSLRYFQEQVHAGDLTADEIL